MKRLIALFALVAAIAVAAALPVTAGEAAAPAPAVATPDPARIEAARDLMNVTGVSRQLDGMLDAMKQGFARGANANNSEAGGKMSAEFDAVLGKFASYKEEMITDFAVLYAETFTAEEMKTVADFYRSGAGAKFISMTPELMKKGASIGMKYSEKIIQEMKAVAPAPAPPKP